LPQLTIAFFAILAAWLQTSVFSAFPLMGTHPDLLLTAVVFLGLYSDDQTWPLRYWLIGLLKDVLSAGPLGVYATSFTIVGLLMSRARGEVYRDHPITRAGLVFTAVIFANGAVAFAQGFVFGHSRPLDLSRLVLSEAAYTAVLAPFFMAAMRLCRALLALPPSKDLSRAV